MNTLQKKALFLLVAIQFLIMLGIGLIIPVEPYIKKDMALTATDMGIMAALFAGVEFIASPVIGRISDKIARVPLIKTGLLVYAISEAIFALGIGHALWYLNVSRILGGLSAALSVPCITALASDMTTSANRARVIGWLSASFSGGIILGPGMGGILAGFDHRAPFFCSAFLGLIAFVVLILFMPNDKEIKINQPKSNDISTPPKSGVFWNTNMKMLMFMILVSSFGLAAFENMFSIYCHDVRGFDLNDLALILTVNGLVSIIVQLLFFEKWVTCFKELKIIKVSFFVSFCAVLWILFAQSKWEIFIATLLVFVSFDLLRPAITTLLSKFDSSKQGYINGLNMSLTSVGNVCGPIIGGVFLDISDVLPYSFVGGILACSTVLTGMIKIKNT